MILVVVAARVNGQRLHNLFFTPFEQELQNFDTTLVDPCLDKLVLRVFQQYNGNHLQIKSGDDQTLYSANAKHQLGFGFGYRWLILNFGLFTPFKNQYHLARGETQKIDIQFQIYPEFIQLDGRTQFHRGYFVNPENGWYTFMQDFDDVIVRADISSDQIGGQARYTFNKKYTHKHGFDQMRILKKSGDSFFTGIRASFHNTWADSAFFQTSFGVNEVRSFDIGAGLGYAFTELLGEGWFVQGAFAYYGLYSEIHMEGEGEQTEFQKISLAPDFRVALGWTNTDHYFGFYGVLNGSSAKDDDQNGYFHWWTVGKVIYAYRLPVGRSPKKS